MTINNQYINSVKKKLQAVWLSPWLARSLIMIGIVLIGLSYYQQISQEAWYWWKNNQGIQISVDPSPDSNQNQKIKTVEPKSTEYGLIIEKIGVNEKVAPDINPYVSSIYLPALEKNPIAEADFSVDPGQIGSTYLFGHSTVNLWDIGRYKAPFTLLHKLESGDRIVVYYQGERFNYRVTSREIVAPTDVEVLTATYDKPVLVLQTCDPPGENTERLLVYAELEAGMLPNGT